MHSEKRKIAKSTSELACSSTSAIVSILKAAGIGIKLSDDPYVEATFQNGLVKSLEFIIIFEAKDKVEFPEIKGATVAIFYEIIFPMKKVTSYISTDRVTFEPSGQDEPSFEWHVKRMQGLEKKIRTIINQSLDTIIGPFTEATII